MIRAGTVALAGLIACACGGGREAAPCCERGAPPSTLAASEYRAKLASAGVPLSPDRDLDLVERQRIHSEVVRELVTATDLPKEGPSAADVTGLPADAERVTRQEFKRKAATEVRRLQAIERVAKRLGVPLDLAQAAYAEREKAGWSQR